ncbi:MAG TPA: alpha-1,4-glucan--maltose-1-phosphate maltosyltransferase, partial [Thermoanaerobaculia bacterium]|nr:alpha-1,4-glucan--maltose-1-phosphate maltosyltransferase [Thermoanaerobaculia bacterium]
MQDGRKRVVIEGVEPEIDCGRFAAKRIVGDRVIVEADIYTDGHDAVSALLLWRAADETLWREVPMQPLVNDRWQADFTPDHLGRWLFTVEAWVDRFATWYRDMRKRVAAGQDPGAQLLVGMDLIEGAIARARLRGTPANEIDWLSEWSQRLETGGEWKDRTKGLFSGELLEAMSLFPDRSNATLYPHELPVRVEREKARFSTWYELFPRSTGQGSQHGTFRDVERLLPYVRELGFDVLYLPPIHPIGTTFRKGKNNTLDPTGEDLGSPWAIGSEAGGHRAIHRQLGTIEDLRHLIGAAGDLGIEIALDIAFQASPDHPLVREHPEWFRRLPDGSIQYAENPPKKYQDIYPFDFESEEWRSLWVELRDTMLYWAEQGVYIFRVDNPHTKPFAFWEWAIAEVHERFPEVIFLSEAFTRPKVMSYLAKAGFTQSYTYFTWRNTSWELREYMLELTRTKLKEFFRPNFWPNTPDILHEYLQHGGRGAFMSRISLAATLTASYGIYGPAFELLDHQPREPGSEEYLHSEKYQLREWDLDHPDSLREFIARINRIRRENRALQSNENLEFHRSENDQILCY